MLRAPKDSRPGTEKYRSQTTHPHTGRVRGIAEIVGVVAGLVGRVFHRLSADLLVLALTRRHAVLVCVAKPTGQDSVGARYLFWPRHHSSLRCCRTAFSRCNAMLHYASCGVILYLFGFPGAFHAPRPARQTPSNCFAVDNLNTIILIASDIVACIGLCKTLGPQPVRPRHGFPQTHSPVLGSGRHNAPVRRVR